jgi:hypothetical protein
MTRHLSNRKTEPWSDGWLVIGGLMGSRRLRCSQYQNARCGVEKALQEIDYKIATSKPVNNGNKFRIERCRAAAQFGEAVLNEPMCDLSVVIGIARVLDQILEAIENQNHRECRCIVGILTRVINLKSTHSGVSQYLIEL